MVPPGFPAMVLPDIKYRRNEGLCKTSRRIIEKQNGDPDSDI